MADAPQFEFPAQMRELAEKNVAQAKSRLRSVHGCGPQGAGRDWDHAAGELDDSWYKAGP